MRDAFLELLFDQFRNTDSVKVVTVYLTEDFWQSLRSLSKFFLSAKKKSLSVTLVKYNTETQRFDYWINNLPKWIIVTWYLNIHKQSLYFCNHLVKLRLIRPLDHTGTSRTKMAGKSSVELPDPVSKDPSAIRGPVL